MRSLFSHPKLDHLIEGDLDVLIERGRIREDRLRQEMLTTEELRTAAQRQGFRNLAEAERAVIEPGGTTFFERQEPTPDEVKQAQLISRLNSMSEQLKQIRQRI